MTSKSSKRNRKDADLNQPATASTPPPKKQKLANETLETKEDIQVSLKIHTKLGDSQTSFNTNDLQKIIYFKTLFSNRWNNSNNNNNNNNICNITSNDLCFAVDEVVALIFYKKHNKMDVTYPHNRLPHICNASAYFTETIESNAFKKYFADCIPAIKYKDLTDLKLLCQTKECENLLPAINETIKQIAGKAEERSFKIIKEWQTAPIDLLTSNRGIVAGVFCAGFVIVNNKLKFTTYRSSSDLNKLWKCICDSKMYLVHSQIIDAVYKLAMTYRCEYKYKETLDAVTNIVVDVMQICLENDLKYTQNENEAMINNIFCLMASATKNDSNYYDRQLYFHCNFLFAVLKKLVDLRNKNNEKYLIYFGNGIIVKLLQEKFDKIVLNDINDIELLKEQFTKTEQYELLKCLLNNYQTLMGSNTNSVKYRQNSRNSQNLMKQLIEIDYEQGFKLTNLWFPIFMKDHKNWIVNELPQKTSLSTLQILIDGIIGCRNIAFDTSYFEFINQYTTTQWKRNNNQ